MAFVELHIDLYRFGVCTENLGGWENGFGLIPASEFVTVFSVAVLVSISQSPLALVYSVEYET
jgi:hypothetical protein